MSETQIIDDYLERWRIVAQREKHAEGLRLYDLYQETREYRIGEERFLRADLVARSHRISAARFRSWLTKGTPSGDLLRSIQTLSVPHRYYVHVSEYERVDKHLSDLARRAKRTPQPT